MDQQPGVDKEVIKELEELRARLQEAEETLHAFRSSQADVASSASPKGPAELLLHREQLEEIIEQRTVELEAEISERKRTEQSLIEREELFRSVFEMSENAIFVIDNHGRFLQANPAAAELLQTPQDELAGCSISEFVEDEAAYQEAWADFLKKSHFHGEWRVVRPDESVRIVEIFATANILPGVHLAVVHDMTDRVQAQESLRRSNRRFEILSQISGKLLVSESPIQLVQSICEQVMEFLGCHVFFNYIVDESRLQLHLNAYAGIPKETAREIEWLDFDTAVCSCAARDGSRIVVRNVQTALEPCTDLVKSFGVSAYACHPLEGNEGRILGTLSFGSCSRDRFDEDDLFMMKLVSNLVSVAIERIRAEEAIASARNESERRAEEAEEGKRILDALMAYVPEGITIVDAANRHIRMVSRHGQEMVGTPAEIIPGIPVEEHAEKWVLYHLDGITPAADEELPLTRAVQQGEVVSNEEWVIRRSDGSLITISCNAGPIRDDTGEITGGVITWRDVSRLREVREREQHIADMLQKALVPPEVPTRLENFQIAVKYQPGHNEAEVGGDFYDVFRIDEDRVGLLIGDVAGKGLKAAMHVASARYTLRTCAMIDIRPSRILKIANQALYRHSIDEMESVGMLTAFFAVLDLRLGTLTYTNAGHVPPYLIKAKGGLIDDLGTGGMPLGIIEDTDYPEESLRLDPGDTVVMVTDGVTEARSKGELFETDGVIWSLEQHRGDSLDEIAEALLLDANNFAGGHTQDDVALLLVRYQHEEGAGEGETDDRETIHVTVR